MLDFEKLIPNLCSHCLAALFSVCFLLVYIKERRLQTVEAKSSMSRLLQIKFCIYSCSLISLFAEYLQCSTFLFLPLFRTWSHFCVHSPHQFFESQPLHVTANTKWPLEFRSKHKQQLKLLLQSAWSSTHFHTYVHLANGCKESYWPRLL